MKENTNLSSVKTDLHTFQQRALPRLRKALRDALRRGDSGTATLLSYDVSYLLAESQRERESITAVRLQYLRNLAGLTGAARAVASLNKVA